MIHITLRKKSETAVLLNLTFLNNLLLILILRKLLRHHDYIKYRLFQTISNNKNCFHYQKNYMNIHNIIQDLYYICTIGEIRSIIIIFIIKFFI